jgi:DNA repair exonuclease SbcCD ATPase subunit
MDDGDMTDEGMRHLSERLSRVEQMILDADRTLAQHAQKFAKHVELSEIGWANHARLSSNITDSWERIEKELSATDRAVDSHNQRLERLEHGIKSMSEQGNADRDRVNQLSGGVAPETPAMSELRDAYMDLRQSPWNRHSEKLARLYGAVDAVLGGPVQATVRDGLTKSQTTLEDERNEKYFMSGYTAGKKDGMSTENRAEIYRTGWRAGYHHGQVDGVTTASAQQLEQQLAQRNAELSRLKQDLTTVTFDEPVGPIIGQDSEKRKLIGPPHAHQDAPCTEACFEDPSSVGVVHSHGQHEMHPHSAADYDTHQRPIENERRLDSNEAPVGHHWPQAE